MSQSKGRVRLDGTGITRGLFRGLRGARLKVSAASAGSTVRCKCTQSITVPRLSQLRQAAGEKQFQPRIIDTIRQMISRGELPPSRKCAATGGLTDDVAEFYIECDRVWHRGSDKGRIAFAIFALFAVPLWWIWALLFPDLMRPRRDEFGCDATLRVPLPLCNEYHCGLRRMSQRKLRHLLRSVAVYATLLDEYPKARISVAKVIAQ